MQILADMNQIAALNMPNKQELTTDRMTRVGHGGKKPNHKNLIYWVLCTIGQYVAAVLGLIRT
jgi:hypothetical protein